MENPKKIALQKESTLIERIGIKLVKSMLSKMQRGQLTIMMPDKSLLSYGDNPSELQANIAIKNYDFFRKCFLYGDIGFGESYMDGDWTTTDLTSVIKWMILNIENLDVASGSQVKSSPLNVLKLASRFQHMMNKNTKDQGRKNIQYHYDLSNDFFQLMLDQTMTYSSGVFENEDSTLKDAQIRKYSRLANFLKIKKQDHVLEIGSGWGGNAIYLAQTYGCRVTSITLSVEQLKFAQEKAQQLGLDHLVNFRLLDYRELQNEGIFYDKIVSIEMIEAVGHEYMEEYFKTINKVLTKDGIVAVQAITCPDSRYDEYRTNTDWIQKHIFPGGLLPSVGRIQKAVNKVTDFHLHHLEDIGLHYAKTLQLWREQFYNKLSQVRTLGLPDTFIRKWEYYLCYCEAAFLMRNISTVQFVLVRTNNTQIRDLNFI